MTISQAAHKFLLQVHPAIPVLFVNAAYNWVNAEGSFIAKIYEAKLQLSKGKELWMPPRLFAHTKDWHKALADRLAITPKEVKGVKYVCVLTDKIDLGDKTELQWLALPSDPKKAIVLAGLDVE